MNAPYNNHRRASPKRECSECSSSSTAISATNHTVTVTVVCPRPAPANNPVPVAIGGTPHVNNHNGHYRWQKRFLIGKMPAIWLLSSPVLCYQERSFYPP